MKALEKIAKLADKFEHKYAQVHALQGGTTELFFDTDANQKEFAKQVMNPESPVYKVLLNYFEKNKKICAFTLDAAAVPDSGAKWILTVNPPSLLNVVSAALNTTFQSIVNKSMSDKQKEADAAAKNGQGTGQARVAEIELTP